jgi:hypothetical protein
MAFPIIAALILGSTAVQVYSQLEAGKDQEAALKTQAEEERVAAESRELERQQKLNKALAANAVGMGMSGIKTEGTPSSISLQSSKNVGLSEGRINLSDRLAQAQLRRQASTAASAAKIGAASTLLSGAVSAYQAMPGGGGITEATGTYSSDWNYNG